MRPLSLAMGCFNTQPPKGGWRRCIARECIVGCFNTQPPKGGWAGRRGRPRPTIVSTHSRLKAAGNSDTLGCAKDKFQHTAA